VEGTSLGHKSKITEGSVLRPFSYTKCPLADLVKEGCLDYTSGKDRGFLCVSHMDMKEQFILRSLGLMEQPLVGDNYVYSLSLSRSLWGISWPGSHAFENSLCGLHSEWHMDMNQVPPVPPNQDLNPLLLQIKNKSRWTIREWFMALIDSCRKQWIIVHLLNCNFHQRVPSTYLFIMCVPTHSQTFKGAPLDLWPLLLVCKKSIRGSPGKHYKALYHARQPTNSNNFPTECTKSPSIKDDTQLRWLSSSTPYMDI
jgi:hypothetical protein